MSTFSRMDRTIVHRTTLGQQGRDAGVPAATPVERIMMVWPLEINSHGPEGIKDLIHAGLNH